MQTFPAQSPVPTSVACLVAPTAAARVHQRWRCVDEDTGKVTRLWVDEAGDWHVATGQEIAALLAMSQN